MVAAVAAAAAPIIGGIIGNLASKGDREKAAQIQKEMSDLINNVGLPPDLSKEIILEKYRQAGVLTPELETTIQQQSSKVEQIQEDPRLRNAQMDALSQMQQVGKSGMRMEDQAALAKIRNAVQADQQSNQAAIMQNMQARGQAGSGAELAARLLSSQQAAQQQAGQGLDVAAQASQRALQAINQGAQMGNQIRGQDFNVNQARASAADEVNRFNSQNAQNVMSRNVGAQNQAQGSNLQNAQNVSNQNVGGANQEKYRQADAQRQFWQDKLGYAQAQAGALSGQKQDALNNADRTAAMWSGIGAGAGQGAASAMMPGKK